MTYEEYILTIIASIVVGIVVGWLGKRWEYKRKKLSLRDEKFLEGKIAVYHDLLKIIGEFDEALGSWSAYLLHLSKSDIEKIESEFNNLNERILINIEKASVQTPILNLYCNRKVLELSNLLLKKLGNYQNLTLNIHHRFPNITEKDRKDIDSSTESISETIVDLGSAMREDLGFEKGKSLF